MHHLHALTWFCFTAFTLAEDNPVPYITKCKWDDALCITASTNAVIAKFADGIPEANVEKMDPLLIDKIDASTPELQFLIDDAKVDGLRNCVAERIERNLEKSKLYIAIQCTADFNSDYVMKGNLLTLKTNGKNKMKITLRKILINVDIDLEEYEKNGKKYWRIKKWDYSFELKGKSDVDLGTIAPDNKVLDKAVQDLLANNANQIVIDLCPPILKAVIGKVLNNIDKFFEYVSLDNLIIS